MKLLLNNNNEKIYIDIFDNDATASASTASASTTSASDTTKYVTLASTDVKTTDIPKFNLKNKFKRYYDRKHTNLPDKFPPIINKQEDKLGDEEWCLIESGDDDDKKELHKLNKKLSTIKLPSMPGSFLSRYTASLTITINDVVTNINLSDLPSVDILLVDYLRASGLTGTKIGCKEGGCGACTVLLNTGTEIVQVNSCLRLLLSCSGMSVMTIEWLGNFKKGFDPIQKALANGAGTHCGYCSSGMCMNMAGLMVNSALTKEEMQDQFSGNICRCTGYRPIMASFMALVKPDGCTGTCATCPSKEACGHTDIEDSHLSFQFIEPPSKAFYYSNDSVLWFRPTLLSDVYSLLQTYSINGSIVKVVVGNTSIGIVKYYTNSIQDPDVIIDISQINELSTLSNTNGVLTIGAIITLNGMSNFFKSVLTTNPSQSVLLNPLNHHINLIANPQVRNAGSWGGNLMVNYLYPDFCSDILTMFSSLNNVTINLNSASKGPVSLLFVDLTSYTFAVDELIVSMSIALLSSPANFYFDTFKIMARHQNSHALVNASFFIGTDSNNNITSSSICYGGVMTNLLMCKGTSLVLQNKPLFSSSTLTLALSVLNQECTPPADPPALNHLIVDPAYRQSCATSLFYKFFLSMQTNLPANLVSAVTPYIRPLSSGVETFVADASTAPVSEPIAKYGGISQVSGDALYVCDRPYSSNTLFACFIYSTVGSATIESFDTSVASAYPGVVDILFAKDIALLGGNNNCGGFPGDEEIFASTTVGYYGQPLGLVLASSELIANKASKLVIVNYANIQTPILTIDEAIAANSYLKPNQYNPANPIIQEGDVTTGLANSAFKLSGELNAGHQYHFYMETQACVIEPDENRVLRVYCSTQGPADVANTIATAINRAANRIIVVCPRVGGAFGGKLTRCHPGAAALALAVVKHNVPVRMQLERQSDMTFVGKRHPFKLSYSVGFNKDYTIQALQMNLYINGGFCYDTTFGSMSMAMLWADNCYNFPNYYVNGVCCKTNLAPNTAMRSPGVVASVHFVETIIERVALSLGVSPQVVREANFYKNGQLTPYKQPLNNITLPSVWNGVITNSNYVTRLAEIQTFNSSNRWVKRGISVTPVKYGLEVAGNDQTVLITIDSTDCSVNLSHSGCELGQGLTTKVMQTVAYLLSISMDLIVPMNTSTEKTPNCTMTGGSSTSESVCSAAILACNTLNDALKPYRTTGISWSQLIQNAAEGGVNLCAYGHFNPIAASNAFPFDYFVWAAAVSEVRIDVLTGQIQILQCDIMYDCGQSLNPTIDIGQIEGGFIQSIGYFFTEECVYEASTGRFINVGTWDYKPLLASDIPISFNVSLLPNAPNTAPLATLRSKASAEPPMILASSVLFAARMAIQSARHDAKLADEFIIPQPLGVSVIQRLCGVDISQMSLSA